MIRVACRGSSQRDTHGHGVYGHRVSLDILYSGSHSKVTKTCTSINGRQGKLTPESWSLLKSEFGLHRQKTVPQADVFVR